MDEEGIAGLGPRSMSLIVSPWHDAGISPRWSMAEQMVVKLRLATGTPDNLEDKDQGTGVVAEMTWAEQQGEGGMTEPEADEEAMELCNAILGC